MSNPYAPPEDRRRPADDDSAAPPQGSSPAGPPTQGSTPPGPPHPPPHWYPPQQHPGQHDAGPQGQQHPGQQHPGQYPPAGHDPRLGHPKPEPLPTDPAGAERARTLARTFGLYLLAAVVLSTIRAPWQAVALPFVVVAIVYAIRALVTATRAHVRGALVPMLAGGIAIAAFWAFVTAGMLALWPLQADREECLAGALTISATAECNQTFEQGLQDWRDRIGTRSGG
ncbi:cytochrome d ubiquinol oxidase subunit II [Cellulomonas sp. PhB150]|uniref:cytochrome d ubiquinol oxidase subunit II n=1 Tax=Cellulomonas sp. PhB150 TaxID=2485188 RepID=UPI0011CEC2A5|nr:cytochrome d ubiquinol oxidase subunit II [Cellulomonas sp. PhB150]